MNLKNIFGNNKKEIPAEYFLAVEIHESLIKSVCWELLDGEPKVIGQGSFEMWEDEESLINGVDASITEAVKNITPEPRRVIFGLPESWLGDDGIHPTKRNLISKIISELKLEPIGVVPTTQAIAHFLKQKEGIPPTAILLEIYSSKIVVSVLKLGKVEATEEVGASGDLARDVEEGLARMEIDRLPARFLLTDGGNLEDEQQQILSYPWQERLPFVHMPKVEVLPVDLSIMAIALAGGTEAAQHLGFEVKATEETVTPKKDLSPETSNIYIPETKPGSDLEKMGFSFEETSPPEEIPVESEIQPPAQTQAITINEMGGAPENAQFAVSEEETPIAHTRPKISLPNLLSKFNLPNRFSFGRLAHFKFLPIALLLITLVLGGASAAYFFLGKATIKVYVIPQKLTGEFQLAIAESVQPDLPTLIAKKQTVSGSANEKVDTTGEATVGEKASGNVTIFNSSNTPITIKSGAIFASETGKSSFIIDESVTVASKSADRFTGKEEYGKKGSVVIKSTKIGAEHNLTKNTIFSVDNNSKTIIYAVAESDFAGGTSRTVRAVDKSDQEKVLGLATDKIKEKTGAEIGSQDPDTGSLSLNELHFTQKKFSQAVGDEAASVSLDLAGAVDLLVYSKQALFDLAKKQLQDKTPSGLSFDRNSAEIRIENPTQKGEVYTAKVTVNATLTQQIDQAEYSKMVKGRSFSRTKQLLQSVNGFSDALAITSPSIPFLSTHFLPLGNINIEVIPR